MSIIPRFSWPRRAFLMAIGCLAALGLATLYGAQPAHAQDIIFVDDSVNDGLVAHWKFDEPGSTTALAYVGPADGTLENGATMEALSAFLTAPPVSFVDKGLLKLDGVIDATPQRVLIADDAALNLVTDLSVTAWVQRDPADIGTGSTIYDSGTNAGAWFVGFLSDNRLTFTTDGVTDFPTNLVVTDNGYHHIAFTQSGDELFAYLDGVASAAVTVPFNMPIPSGEKLIGGKTSNNNAPLAGRIDDLRLYNRALTPAEVQRLAAGKSCSTDGATWATAFRDLHCALAEATSGDDIWIGQGTYKPGSNRFVPYQLKNGVDLFGGFTGVTGAKETLLSQRPAFNANAPLTILSGDILGDDAASPFGDPSLYDDNSNTVLAAFFASATVDGLRVQGGNARTGTGDEANGGGLRAIAGSNITLTNVSFFGNQATGRGGGVFVDGTLALTDVNVSSNQAAVDGGGLFATVPLDSAASVAVTIADSLFAANNAVAGTGGGARIDSSAAVTNTRFLDNDSGSEGGALFAAGPMSITRALFLRNQSSLSGAIAAQAPIVNPPSQRLAVHNSLFAANGVSDSAGATDIRLVAIDMLLLHNTFAQPVLPTPNATASIVLSLSAAQVRNNIWANYGFGLRGDLKSPVSEDFDFFANVSEPVSAELLVGSNSLTGDPLFINPATDDYHIAPLSPARDSGANMGIAEDFDGQPRPIGPGFDMGYDETTAVAPTAIAGGPYQGVEGSPVALNGSASSDNGPISSFAWDCTNNGTFESTLAAPTGATCLYPDNGAFALRLRATDADGEPGESTTSVTIANVAPLVTAPAPQSAQVGALASFALGSFADPGPDAPWQVTVDWGDGSAKTILTRNSSGALPAQSHTYGVAAARTVSVNVLDKDGGAGIATFTVNVQGAVVGPPAPSGNLFVFLPVVEQ